MPRSFHKQNREIAPNHSPKERYVGDLMFRDRAFVYPVTMVSAGLGEKTEEWAVKPLPMNCSFQDHALDSEHVDPADPGSHYARVFTRYRNFVKWHDKITCKGKNMLVIKVLERFDNVSGEYQHTEIGCQFLDKPGSINKQV